MSLRQRGQAVSELLELSMPKGIMAKLCPAYCARVGIERGETVPARPPDETLWKGKTAAPQQRPKGWPTEKTAARIKAAKPKALERLAKRQSMSGEIARTVIALRKRGHKVEDTMRRIGMSLRKRMYGAISEMSEKEAAIRMQKQGYEFVVLSGKGIRYAKTVREAGDLASDVKGARVMKMSDYIRGAIGESEEGNKILDAIAKDWKKVLAAYVSDKKNTEYYQDLTARGGGGIDPEKYADKVVEKMMSSMKGNPQLAKGALSRNPALKKAAGKNGIKSASQWDALFENEESLQEGKNRLQLVPAYGRDYKSKKEVESAWNDGKDFMIQDMSSPDDGRYINIQDAENDPDLQEVMIRFKRLTQVAVVKIKR